MVAVCVVVWMCGSCLCGCVDVWLCGCVDVWSCGCVDMWMCGCVVAVCVIVWMCVWTRTVPDGVDARESCEQVVGLVRVD